MVYLHRIYTKSGDAGETSLGDGSRVAKTSPRIVAYGGVDELNSLLGVVRTAVTTEPYCTRLAVIQNDLFDLGADLCVPETSSPADVPQLRISPAQAERLEGWIDEVTEQLAPLTSFVLPGGTTAAAHLHLARSVCRRVEIDVWRLAEREAINPAALIYLNRLSDLLFIWARAANDLGRGDVLWVPGKSR
jgi:cob(I)alamin adenosyltransferase